MSLATPTTSQIKDTIVSQIEGSLSQTIPLLPKAFTRVLAAVLAGVIVLLYKYGGFIFLQLFIRTASFRETEINGQLLTPLVEWGKLIGVGEPEPATRAELVIDITVENQTGTLPANSQFLRASTGVLYLTTAAVALDAATVQATIRAQSDQEGGGGLGAIGNLDPGDIVSLANPLPNVAPDAVVASQAVTAADGETEDVYRGRVLRRWQRRPQGGALSDYRVWGEEDPGIVNVYVYTGDPGEVDVYVEATVASSGSEDGIPTAAQLQEVEDSIELDDNGLASRRPANAAVNVLPISRRQFDVEVSGLAPDTVETREAIEDALDEYLRAREPFIVGLSVLPRRDRITNTAIGGVVEDVVSAAGATVTVVELQDGGSPLIAYTLGEGEKARLGTLTFV